MSDASGDDCNCAEAELAEWRKTSGFPDADALGLYLARETVIESTDRHARVLHAIVERARVAEVALAEALEAQYTAEMKLAGCGVVALANTPAAAKHRISRDNPYWSASYGDVCDAVDREMALRAELAALKGCTKETV